MSASLSHPLLKQLKGCASKLLNESPKPINDYDPVLKEFCESFESILCKGLIPYETLILILTPDCWHWLKNLGDEKCGVPFSYVSSVEDVVHNTRVETNRGKTRLLIRTCLVKKCLHFPVQYLVNEERCCLLYKSSSVLGDPILASVLMSVLLCLTTVSFDLKLDNAQFLDSTWHLPRMVTFTFVPAKRLGLSIMFVEGKAIITGILENSVASENSEIEVGDIVDSVNGRIVDKKYQGSLNKFVRKLSKNPINISLIKGHEGKHPYPPILHYWHQAGLDPAFICADSNEDQVLDPDDLSKKNEICYLGSVQTGNRGDLRQIHLALQQLPEDRNPLPVSIECHHLGLTVSSLLTKEVVVEHNYMEISACGCTQSSSPYFAFIAREKHVGEDCSKSFICHIFKSSESDVVTSFLETVGQGFRRTLYTV